MAAISTWSKTAASNNATPPDGWPEGQNPSTVNDCAREMMAALRTRFEDLEWFNHGHVPVRQSANSFLVSLTATQIYTAGRRIKLLDATTIYGDVISSSPSGANTLVTVSSSALTASLSSCEVSIIDPTNRSLPTVSVITVNGQHLTLGTEQASTAGTAIDFTSIPSWVKRITVMFKGVSTSGTSPKLIQIGDSGGVETASYNGSGLRHGAASGAVATFTTGLGINSILAADQVSGTVVISLEDSSDNTWTMTGNLSDSASTQVFISSCSKALSAALDRVRITTVGGADTFDLGSINILYE